MSLMTRTDVTAVKLHKNFVLAGIGSTINVYDKEHCKLLHKLHVLNGQKIYGFVPSSCGEKILVFGGKQFAVVSLICSGELDRMCEPVICDDWLHSAVWMDNNIISLLTAHNCVQKWDTANQILLSQHTSRDNSILYSGLLMSFQDDLLVMAGTVFSEVIIHRCGDHQPLHNLKGHKGVIFSITCKPEKHIIVTSSDDRAVRIWGPNIVPTLSYNTMEYWHNIDVVCKHQLYGHLARVMRSCITNDLVVSVGEDSAICYWNYEGQLLKKVISHQNGCIWSIDTDGENLITGGGDCGVIMHPLSVAKEYSRNDIIKIGAVTAKKIEFTARRNLVLVDDNDLIYYDLFNKTNTVFNLNYNSTYRLLSLSSCKQLIAVADMTGKLNVFVEICKDNAVLLNLIDTEIKIGKLLSMHWAGNRHLIFCTINGNVTVFSSTDANLEKYASFVLPPCKDALLTAVAINSAKKYFVMGDRCGNIHIFVKGQAKPIKSFSKIHGKYGPRSLTFKGDNIISTGRDHTVKYISNYNGVFKYMHTKDLPFAWAEKFLDKDHNIVCGFQERVFVVYNIRNNSKVLEIPCGGGHRSFDAVRFIDKINDKYEEIVKLVYLKDSDIHLVTFVLSKIVSKNIINGSHAKEINCLKSHRLEESTIFISGGEDTTLRISSINSVMDFQDEICFKNLSCVRTLETFFMNKNNILLISAGGRAQICIKNFKLIIEENKINVIAEELIDYLIKGTDKERKGNQSWINCHVDIDPEMRIMDIDMFQDKNIFIVFAGCSDAYLRIFSFNYDSNEFKVLNELKYHKTCVLKIKLVEISNKHVLITCTTRGDIAFWDTSSIDKPDFSPYFCIKTNKSGINSLVFTTINNEPWNKFLIGTGGDDNAIHLVLLEIKGQYDLKCTNIVHEWCCSKYHNSQITGLCLVDHYLLSASIDQRVTLMTWEIKGEEIECQFVRQMYTDISDVQGMDLISHDSESIKVCVFGKGMEVLVMPKTM